MARKVDNSLVLKLFGEALAMSPGDREGLLVLLESDELPLTNGRAAMLRALRMVGHRERVEVESPKQRRSWV